MTLLLVILLIIIGILVAVIFGMKLKNKVGTVGYTGHATPYYTNTSANNEDGSIEEESEEEVDYEEEETDFEEEETDYEEDDIEDVYFKNNLKNESLRGSATILGKFGEDVFSDFDDIDEEDDGIDDLDSDEESPIVMEISDVFGISGRGAVLCGKLEYPVTKGDELDICREDGTVMYSGIVCNGIERNHKRVDSARVGDSVGLLFTVDASDIERGMMIRG